jgi:circadian clock protein KaiC
LFFAFEESPQQIVRNARSIGVDLEQWVRKGLLQFHAARPTYGGIEQVLLLTHKRITSFRPAVVVVDPVTNLLMVSTQNEVRSMLTRLVDFLKTQQITAIFTSLTSAGALEASEADVSSLMDTWLLLKNIEVGGERNRALYVLKSRGMEHSNQIREFVLTDHGLRLLDVYLGPEGVLTGSARVSQEMREKAVVTFRQQGLESRRRELERKRRIFEARMVMLRAEFEVEEEVIQQTISESELLGKEVVQDRGQMVLSRKADSSSYKKDGRTNSARGH